MSLELWKSIFEYGGVILLFLTFVFGAGVVIATNRINERQAGELRDFNKKLTDAQTELEKQKERASIADGKVAGLQTAASDAKAAQQRVEKDLAVAQKEAADSELALRRYVDLVARSVSPRRIDSKKFLELLKGQPKGTVEIWYVPNDEEASTFASQLAYWLGPKGAGWGVSALKPLPDTGVSEELRRGAGFGLAMVFPKLSSDLTTAGGVLDNAINLSVGGWGIAGHLYSFENPALEENHFILVVGRHQVNLSLAEFGHPQKK